MMNGNNNNKTAPSTSLYSELPWRFMLKTLFVTELLVNRASLEAQLVKNPPAMQETPVQCLGWDDPLEKG